MTEAPYIEKHEHNLRKGEKLISTIGPNVLVVGGGGNFGCLVMDEFIKQKSSFGRVAIFADPAMKDKFAQFDKNSIDVVVGSYFDPGAYKDECSPSPFLPVHKLSSKE